MTTPNKNEGLIARLEGKWLSKSIQMEAARAIQDLEEEVGRLLERDLPSISKDGPHKIGRSRAWLARQLLDSRLDDGEAYGIVADHPAISPSLASTADGKGALRPSASVPAGAVIQGDDNRQERRE